MLTVLVSTISNSQVFLLKKCEWLLQMQKLLTLFFSKNISVYAKLNDQSFNDTLTNDIVSFEQLGPEIINYTTVTNGETFYGLYNELVLAVIHLFLLVRQKLLREWQNVPINPNII